MFYATKQNKYITEGNAFELDGVQYPAVWLNQATAEQKAAIGLQEVIATNSPPDERFYWVSSELNGAELTYVNTPKDLDGLKVSCAQQIRGTAYTLLAPSDWRVIRAIELGQTEQTEWSAYREAVRAKADQVGDAIEAATSVDELAAAVAAIDWPHDPNYVAPAEPEPLNQN